MNRSLTSCLVAGAGVLGLLPALDDAHGRGDMQLARPADHDGVYAVEIVTHKGACDKSYLWTITVAEGRIHTTGVGPIQASGRISAKGVVSLAFRAYNDVAHVVGHMKGRSGSGTWSSPTLDCAGTWRALRRS